jgi:hypothetical protein
MDSSPLDPVLPPPSSLLSETERLQAAKHILCNHVEAALERFSKQTGLTVGDICVERLCRADQTYRYLVRTSITL